MAVTVEITGDFLVESSLARVNRGLFGALARRGEVELALLAEPTAARLDDPELERLRARRFYPNPDVTIRHRWPPVFPRTASGAYVHMQPWEFGSLPKQWAAELREIADDVWCYSRYVADMYVRAGIDAERVHIVPPGFDPAVFAPGPPPPTSSLGDRCVFLYVGDTIARKGIDVAVEAYTRAFKAGDPVLLVVKDFGAKAPGADTRLRDQVRALAERGDIPRVLYLDTTFTDAALADLYRTATALVAPYRGEGFAMPVLEAMACGTMPIVTRGGATDDFVSDATAMRVDAVRTTIGGSYGGLELVDDAFWLEPSLDQLADAMRAVYARPQEARATGARAAEAARAGWTWAHGASAAVERLQALQGGSSRRSAPGPQEFNRFELRVASRGGEDGMLLELFRRLGVADPFFVELVPPGGQASTSLYFSGSLGWRGLVMEAGTRGFDDMATTMQANGAPTELELLVAPRNAAGLWERLAPFRPKVVVVPFAHGGDAPQDGSAGGYALLGVTGTHTSAIYVREDLVPRTRFPALL